MCVCVCVCVTKRERVNLRGFHSNSNNNSSNNKNTDVSQTKVLHVILSVGKDVTMRLLPPSQHQIYKNLCGAAFYVGPTTEHCALYVQPECS